MVSADIFGNRFTVTRDAWDDLTGTGQLALLDEPERIALAAYFRRDEDRARLGDTPSTYREEVLRVVPARS
ncbi:MAG TPA: hypothetical protein VK837_06435 [Longimicrobiales bacterium]|nr:hypothetical protein [Longimicrobiales bacterium]